MKRLLFVLALVITSGLVVPRGFAQDTTITVFAAASMKNALDDMNAAYMKAHTTTKIVASYAASSALMKQIEQGAPADVFVSADLEWMDYGSQKKVIKDDTRMNLLGNRLVLIAGKDSKINNVTLAPELRSRRSCRRWPHRHRRRQAVPVGKYAKAALEKLGIWASVEKKMAMAENVRAALALVARGEAPLGIVYETDAKVEPAVKIVGVFPADSHPPIVYPVALTVTANPPSADYIAFLRSDVARTVFEKYGFSLLMKPAS